MDDINSLAFAKERASNSRSQTVFIQPMWLELALMTIKKINNNRLIDIYLRVNKMVYSVFTQRQYITFSGYMFHFLQNHLQANVNYREAHGKKY